MRKYFLLLYLALTSGPLLANPSMFGEVAQELDKMVALDQSLMQELFKCKNEGKKSCSIIEDNLNDVIDSNSEALSKIIDKHGWISKSKFGEQADRNAWLIAQHSRDVGFQHRVLFLLENLLPEQETSPENYALLYDRISLKYETQGIKQKYGTQFSQPENGLQTIRPYSGSIDDVNKRRNELGMAPLSEYMKLLEQLYGTTVLIE